MLTTDVVHETHPHRQKSLVIGGAGFIGSYLCEALIAQNQHVTCLDDLTSGSIQNVAALQKNPRFTFIEADLNEFDFTYIGKTDYVFHLAGLEAHLKEGHPSLQTLLTNSIGTKRALDYIITSKAKLLFASIVDIYFGIASSLSLRFYYGKTEEDDIRFSHNEAKRFGEALVGEYEQKYAINSRVVRVADVYGPRMDFTSPNRLNKLFAQAIKNETLTLPNDGLQIFHPTYVADVVYGIQRAMLLEGTGGGIYYLVNPKEVEGRELATQLIKATNHAGACEIQKTAEMLFPPAKIEIEKTREELRWEPKVSLPEGITLTVEAFTKAENNPTTPAGITLSAPAKPETEKTDAVQPVAPESQAEKPVEQSKKTGTLRVIINTLFSKKLSIPTTEKTNSATTTPISSIVNPPEKEVKKQGSGTRQIGRIIRMGIVSVSLFLVLIGLLGPVFSSAFFSFQGLTALKKAKDEISVFNLPAAQTELNTAVRSFKTAQTSLEGLIWFATIIQQREIYQDGLYLLSAGEDVSRALLSVTLGIDPTITAVKNSLSNAPEAKTDFQKISRLAEVEYSLALNKLSEAQAKTEAISLEDFPRSIQTKMAEVKSQIVFARSLIEEAGVVNRLLPVIAGQESDKVYLFLFQNTMERRATGGFIGSYGRILFKNGKLNEVKVDDIYNPDGLINWESVPPEPLRNYLGVVSYGMRDANWSPDFSVTAQQEAQFYERITNEKIDGIIALDLYFVQDLLKLTGPITINDGTETITSDNLFEKAEYQSEVDFTPGSTKKKDFLGELGLNLIDYIRKLPSSEWVRSARLLQTDLVEKHILLNFKEPAVQELAATQSWTGKIQPADADFLWVIDSNVGANKANYYVKRSFDHQVKADKDGQMQTTLSITYVHEGTSDAWPGGLYKNYLRIYVPKGVTLVSAENFKDGPVTTEDLNQTVFSGYIEVPVQSTKTIRLIYQLPVALGLPADKTEYKLFIQKQSGTRDEIYTFSFSWPQYLAAQQTLPPGETGAQKYTYTTKLNLDQPISIKLQKKS